MSGARALRLAAALGTLVWAALALRSFLAGGLPVEFDAASHLARAGFAAQALREGRLPWWSFDWYGGFRMLEFYGPAYYVVVGAVGAALGDAVAATKLVLFTFQLATALAVYAFCRRLEMGPLAAAFGALLFVESPQRGWALGVVGNHPSVLLYAAAAAYLWLAARPPPPEAPAHRLAAGRALLLAAMLLAHLQALLLLPALLAFDVARLAPVGGRRALAVAAGSLAGMAALTACLWLPVWLDLPLVSLSLDTARAAIGFDLASLRIALGLEAPTWDHTFVRDHGSAWLALGLASAAVSAVSRDGRGVSLAAGLVASAASLVAFGERAFLGLGLFVWPLCALVPTLVAARLPASLRARGAEAALAVAGLAALAGFAPSPEPARYAAAGELDAYAALPPTPTDSRSFDVTPRSLCLDGFYGSSAAAPLVSGRAVPFGGFPQGAPLSANLGLAALGRLAAETTPSQASLDALYLAHVGILVDRGKRPRTLALDPASPALFSVRLETLPAELAPPAPAGGAAGGELRLMAALRARWRDDPLGGTRRDPSLAPLARTAEKRDFEVVAPAVAAMQIDRGRAVAARIFVDGPAPDAPAEPPAGSLRLEVQEHREAGAAVELAVRAPAPGWLRLAYAHDPGLEVRIDEREAPVLRDSLGAVVVAVPAGVHRVALRAPTPAGWRLLLAGCGALAAGMAWLAAPWRPAAPGRSRRSA